MNSKSENSKNTVKKKNTKLVISIWSLSGWTNKLSSKSENSEKKKKGSKAIWPTKRLNTGKKLKVLNASLTTISIPKYKTSKSSISIKSKLSTTKTPNSKKSSILKTYKLKAFSPKTKKSKIIMKTHCHFWNLKMKIWKTKWSNRSTSMIWNWKIWSKNWMVWEIQSSLYWKMPTKTNLIYSTDKLISCKKSSTTGPGKWRNLQCKGIKWEMTRKMKSLTVKLSLKPKSTKTRTWPLDMNRNLKIVILNTKPRNKNLKPLKLTTKAKFVHLKHKRIPWMVFWRLELKNFTELEMNRRVKSRNLTLQSKNSETLSLIFKMTCNGKQEKAAR